jgi:hypothetical protein
VLLPGPTRQLIEIALNAEYVGDLTVPIEHLKFLTGHEIGEAEIKLDGLAILGKDKEHFCDCVGARLLDVATAIAAVEGFQRWREARGLTGSDEDSSTHPSTEERLRYLREHCV